MLTIRKENLVRNNICIENIIEFKDIKINSTNSTNSSYSSIVYFKDQTKILKLYTNLKSSPIMYNNFISFYNNFYIKKNITKEYFCKIHEFGSINELSNNKSIKNFDYYIIYDNCGENIKKYCNNNNINLNIIETIISQCYNAVNIFHKGNYIHFDTRPENFVITKINNNIQVKIIDFDFFYKIIHNDKNINNLYESYDYEKIGHFRADASYGHILYRHPFVELMPLIFNKKYIIRPDFDIYPIGLMYIELLAYLKFSNIHFSGLTLLKFSTKDDIHKDNLFNITLYERLKILFHHNYYNIYFSEVFKILDINDDEFKKKILTYMCYYRDDAIYNTINNKKFDIQNTEITNIDTIQSKYSKFILTKLDECLIDNQLEKYNNIHIINTKEKSISIKHVKNKSTKNISNKKINVYYAVNTNTNIHLKSTNFYNNSITNVTIIPNDSINLDRDIVIDDGKKVIKFIDIQNIKNIIYNYFFQYFIYIKNEVKKIKMSTFIESENVSVESINEYYFRNINDHLDFLLKIYEIGDIRDENGTLLTYYYITENYNPKTIDQIHHNPPNTEKKVPQIEKEKLRGVLETVKTKIKKICETLQKYNFYIENISDILVSRDEDFNINEKININIRIKMLQYNNGAIPENNIYKNKNINNLIEKVN
jgi:hypothetical protein